MARITSKGGPITDKQELFCQEYVINPNAREAYIKAGYIPTNAEFSASRLLSKVKIKTRIAQIQAVQAKKHNITRETQLAKFDQAAAIALSQNNPSAMVSAIREQNDMLGYHREAAPNPEAEAAWKQRLDEETQALREQAKERIRIISIKDAG